ncbi:MAG: ParB/RepB/Spo0J family partition protein [bacterium]
MTATVDREYREAVPLDVIDEPALAARATMDERKLEELAADISTRGVIFPLALVRVGARYEIIAGHRRYLASRMAGRVVVPALIYPTKDAALEGIKLVENILREDLNPAEEALYLRQLLERVERQDTDVLAVQLGVPRERVEQRLALLRLDPDTFEALRRGTIRVGIAQQLQRVTDLEMRRYFLDAAIRGGATTTVVTAWVTQWQRDVGERARPAAPAPAAPSTPSMETAPAFTCACCGRTDNVHLMRPMFFHQHCWLANVVPMLEAFRGQ